MTKLASAALAVALALSVAAGQDAPAVTAADSTNLSIQIGCLQAEYYSYAADGTGLTAAQRGGGPAPIGARKSSATEPIKVCPAHPQMLITCCLYRHSWIVQTGTQPVSKQCQGL